MTEGWLTSFLAGPGLHHPLYRLAVVVLLLLARIPRHFDQVVGVRFKVVLVLFVAAKRQEST